MSSFVLLSVRNGNFQSYGTNKKYDSSSSYKKKDNYDDDSNNYYRKKRQYGLNQERPSYMSSQPIFPVQRMLVRETPAKCMSS